MKRSEFRDSETPIISYAREEETLIGAFYAAELQRLHLTMNTANLGVERGKVS